MKKTWKNWLAALTACAFSTGPVWSQQPSGQYPAGGGRFSGPSLVTQVDDEEEGAAIVGQDPSGSLADAQYYPTPGAPGGPVDPNVIYDGGPRSYFDDSVGFACTTDIDRILWRVGRTDFDLAGVPDSYTTLNAFVPFGIAPDNSFWWINPRVFLSDSNGAGGSVGLGHRFYIPAEDRVYGASFWWDFDNAHVGNYHALGGSFESIGRYGSTRINFALPVGREETVVSQVGSVNNPVLQGTYLGYNTTTTLEHAYQRYDFEYAVPMPFLARYGVEVGAGGYYLNGQGDAKDGAGFSLRTQAQVTEDFWINGYLTTDPVFGANYSMNMELTIPDGKASRWFRRNSVCSSMTASVLRQYRIPVSQTSSTAFTSYTNCTTGEALQMAIIDPNASATGDGTFMTTADYMALAATDRDDYGIILVRQLTTGAASNVGTPMELTDGQQLYGDGSGALTFFASEGEFFLPGQTIPVGGAFDPGAERTRALLTNSLSALDPVITLANGNRVSGLQIDGSGTGVGISGTAIDGFYITDNAFSNVVDGVVITTDTTQVLACPDLDDIGVVSDNIVGGTGVTNPVDPGGIVITHSTGHIDLLVSGNRMNGFSMFGADLTFNGDGTANAQVVDNILGARDGVSEEGNGTGLRFTVTDTATVNAAIQDNTTIGNVDDGMFVIADGAGATLNLRDISYDASGALLAASDTTAGVSGNLTKLNGLDGMRIVADNGAALTIDQISGNQFGQVIDATTFEGNGDDGLELTALNGSTLTWQATLLNNTFAGNGVTPPGFGAPLPSEIGAGLGNGLEITVDAGSTIIGGDNSNALFDGGIGQLLSPGTVATAATNSNRMSNNLGNGIAIELNGGEITLDGIYNNYASDNGENGLSIVNNEGGVLTVDNDTANVPDIQYNAFNDNAVAGMFIGGEGAGLSNTTALTTLGVLADNQFNRTTAGVEGILFDTVDVFTSLSLKRNEFIGSATAGRGIGGTISRTPGVVAPQLAGLDLSLVATAPLFADANIFQDNTDAHIGLIFEGGTENNIEITGHDLSEATDGSLSEFFGEGVSLINRNSTLTGFIKSSNITLNDGDGIRIESNGGQVNGFEIGGTTIGDGNVISQNGMIQQAPFGSILGENQFHGIHIVRRADGQFNNLLIARNDILQNGVNPTVGETDRFGNGIFIDAGGSDQLALANSSPDTIDIVQNNIIGNLGDGIEILLRSDADVRANITGNVISENGFLNGTRVNAAADGISVRQVVASYLNTPSMQGTWQGNTITGNSNDGIGLDGQYGDYGFSSLLIGVDTLNPIGVLDPLGNLIADNGGDGIQVTQNGYLTIANNAIMRNGTLGAGGTIVNAGINIDGNFLTNATVPPSVNQFIDIYSNVITENVGDGIEWLAEGMNASLLVQNNLIQLNEGRGVDLLIRPGDTDTTDSDNVDPNSPIVTTLTTNGIAGDVTIVDNYIGSNLLEGIYVVGTNSRNQSQSASSSTAMQATGSYDHAYFLRLDVHGNDVIGNGINSNFEATGLVVRVGTTDGGYDYENAGGFATDGLNFEDLDGDGILDNDINGDGYLNAASGFGQYGGISASVTNNNFSGNNGGSIHFSSFTSTGDPLVTQGTWNAATFNVTRFDSDPLARLDLIFTDNTFGAVDVNNLGAYYDNSEGTFKSRTTNVAPGGPFPQTGGATRRRNAQRLASNYSTNNPLAPGVPAGAEDFLYSGMGDSTFRVIGGTNTYVDPVFGPTVVGINSIFFLDDPSIAGDPTIVDATFEAGGVNYGSAPFAIFGELRYGWGTIIQGRTGETNP